MLILNDVTLFCLETRDLNSALKVIKKSCEKINFAKILLVTYNENYPSGIYDNSFIYNINSNIDFPLNIEIINLEKDFENPYEISFFIARDLGHLTNKTNFCLTIQTDGWIINPNSWSNDFLKYDYIGAPWEDFTGFTNIPLYKKVGNGGFSIRSQKYMQKTNFIFNEISTKTNKDLFKMHPEDKFFCQDIRDFMIESGINFAPITIARQFSCENQKITNQFGFHGKLTLLINNLK